MLDSLILKSFLKIRIGSVSLRIFKYGDAVAKTTKAAVIKPSMIGRDEGGGKLALMIPCKVDSKRCCNTYPKINPNIDAVITINTSCMIWWPKINDLEAPKTFINEVWRRFLLAYLLTAIIAAITDMIMVKRLAKLKKVVELAISSPRLSPTSNAFWTLILAGIEPRDFS